MRRGLGHTLVETLVAATLMSIVFTVCAMLLTPGFRAFRRGNDSADLQQNGLLVMTTLTRALESATLKTVYAEGGRIAFANTADKNGALLLNDFGVLLYQSVTTFALDPASQTLRRYDVTIPATDIVDPVWLQWKPTVPGGRIIGRNVANVAFAVGHPITITLTLVKDDHHLLLQGAVGAIVSR